jgi:uncharacterized protein YjbJ (UPF0337 family)
MDSERIKGQAQKIKGVVEKNVGKMVGNEKLENEGRADEAAGEIRKGVGKAKDGAKDLIDKATK